MEKYKESELLAKVLGEPIDFSISDAAAKVKRNLLLASSVVLILVVGGVEASSEVTIFGIELKGVTSNKIMWGLGVALLLLLINYFWLCLEIYNEWCLRLTGTNIGFKGKTHNSRLGDYPLRPSQSTLYSWWRNEAETLEKYHNAAVQMKDDMDYARNKFQRLNYESVLELPEDLKLALGRIEGPMHLILEVYNDRKEVINSERIPASLERFDNRFHFLLTLQNIRSITVDIVVPIFVGSFSFALLVLFLLGNRYG